MKYTTKIFPIDIYKCGIKVFFGNLHHLRKSLIQDGFDVSDLNNINKEILKSHMVTIELTSRDIVIWKPKCEFSDEDKMPLLHEIFHATNLILRSVGIEHSVETEEAYAYLNEYISKSIFDWIYEQFACKL